MTQSYLPTERTSVIKNKAIESGASSLVVKDECLVYFFASTPVTIDDYKFHDDDNDLNIDFGLNAEEKRGLVKLAEAAINKSSRLIVIGGDFSHEKAAQLTVILNAQHKHSNMIKASEFSASSLGISTSPYIIIYTHAKSFSEFALLTLFSEQHLADVFAQCFNISYFSVRVPQLCDSCSTVHVVEDSKRSSPRKGFSYSHEQSRSPSSIGCDNCLCGYTGVYLLNELLSSDNDKLLDFLSNNVGSKSGSLYKKFVNDMQTENINTIFTAASAAIEQGCVSIDDVYKTIL